MTLREDIYMRQQAVEMSNQISGPMTQHEIFWLADRISPSMRILELGCLHGKVTKLFANAAPEVHVDVVDSFVGEPHAEPMPSYHRQQFLSNLMSEIEDDRVALHETTTMDYNYRTRDKKEIYDLIWIDADHSYGAVRQDLEMSMRLAKPEALICGHDLHWYEVRQALEDLKIRYCQVSKDSPVRAQSKNKIWWFER